MAGLPCHGLGVGVAVACSYVPLVAVVGGWFERRRTLAVGVAVSGIGLGTLVGAPAAAALVDAVGWRDAYLVLAVFGVVVLLACAALVRAAAPLSGAAAGPLLPRLWNATYARLYLAGLLLSIALFVPFVHLPAYAEGAGVGSVAAAALVGVIGAASVVGRLALGAVAGWTGTVRAYQFCYALMAGSFALWLGSPGYPRLVVFALLLGVGYGGFVALGPPLVAELFGVHGLGGLLGVLYASAAVGSAVGAPIAGGLIASSGGYRRDGSVVGWGSQEGLVVESDEDDSCCGFSDVVSVAAAPYHALALRRDGTVVGTGMEFSSAASVPPGSGTSWLSQRGTTRAWRSSATGPSWVGGTRARAASATLHPGCAG